MLRLVILIVGVEQLRSRLAVGLSLRSTLMFLFNDKKTLKRMQSCHIKLRLTDMIRCSQQKDLQNIFMNNGLPCPHFLPLRLSRACTDWPKVKWPIKKTCRCWQYEPEDRPHFAEIHATVDLLYSR